MAGDLTMRPTVGMVGGETIQFVEGRQSGEVGDGLAFGDKGFDVIEPWLRVAYPDWTDAHRYGAFDLSQPERPSLVALLRREASRAASDDEMQSDEAKLLIGLADWLGPRCDGRPISILGY